MRTYIFTYYSSPDTHECWKTREYEIKCNRFYQALLSFADYFNALPGMKDFSPTYKVVCDSKICHRIIAHKHQYLLVRSLPDLYL